MEKKYRIVTCNFYKKVLTIAQTDNIASDKPTSYQLLTKKMRYSSKEFASSSCFFPTFKPVFIGSCAYGADRDGNS